MEARLPLCSVGGGKGLSRPARPTTDNKVCCRLRSPSATSVPTGQDQTEAGDWISTGSVVELGNAVVEAGSATARTLN